MGKLLTYCGLAMGKLITGAMDFGYSLHLYSHGGAAGLSVPGT